MNDNKKFWSKVAWIYEKFTRGGKSADKAYCEMEQSICNCLKADMKVLELAAGPGIMAPKIARYCESLEITDFSPAMLEQAKKRKISGNVKFAVADATNLAYEERSFDAVVIANALHIMPEPAKALKEIKRVLKKDGILIAPTFTRENIKSKLIEHIMEAVGFKTYSRWTHHSYVRFMKGKGFTVVEEKIIKGHNFPISFLVCKTNKFS
ncbi:class I SAM-dependent methyltransferase [Lacrimispora sp. 38-1]|uniref:class I SAM-dependent methyltransferase n=1 Tax=Lacrimispora sp. 38-1 TaxID=3125778 RepID=UPI003CF52B65